MKNVSEVGSLCTGCGTCTALCPQNIIKMKINKEKGIYEPIINGKCSECMTCIRTCPGVAVNFEELNMVIFGRQPTDILLGNYKDCYIGYSSNKKLRYKSSSGGMITQILLYLLEEGFIDGALVTRMNPKKPLEPEPFIARTRKEIIEARGSKYCPVPANTALREIIETPGKYAVVGLPCHIHAIRKAEKINKKLRKRIKYHLGIVCNHTPTFKATEFLVKKFGIKKEKIMNISYRGGGWPGRLKIETKNGNISLSHFSFMYWGYFFNNFYFPSRCLLCPDKPCELADASFADAWIDKIMEKDHMGTSFIISRAPSFDKLLAEMKNENKICIRSAPPDLFKESQSLEVIKRRFVANMKIINHFKKVPIYYQKFPETTLSDYIKSILFLSKNIISLKGQGWIITAYLGFFKKASYLKRSLEKVFNKFRAFKG